MTLWTVEPTRLLCPWGLSRQECRSGLPCPPLRDLPHPGIEPRSPALQVDSLPTEPPGKPQTHEKLPGKAVYSKSEIGLLYSKLCVEVFSDLRELYKCADALRPNSNGWEQWSCCLLPLRLSSHSSFTFEVHFVNLDTTLSAVRYRNAILFKIMSEINEETASLFLVAHYKSSIFFKNIKLNEISEFWVFITNFIY